MRFRPVIALFLAYALTLASVLGALSSASLAGTSHLQLCITSAQDGQALPPAHSSQPGLCCFIASGGSAPALLPEDAALAATFLVEGRKIPPLKSFETAGTETSASHPRAPPALV